MTPIFRPRHRRSAKIRRPKRVIEPHDAPAIAHGNIVMPGGEAADPRAWDILRDRLSRTRWIVYAKRPFGGAEHVIRYLGRYTHRVGISNQRLVSMNDDGVTFPTKNGATVTLPPQVFLRRFLQHVLPDGFVKIRHYGLMASSHATTKLLLCPHPPRPLPAGIGQARRGPQPPRRRTIDCARRGSRSGVLCREE
jgi:hypothetical protein